MNEFLWVEKYRPKKLADVALPAALKKNLEQFVKRGELPNLIFAGGPGIGKTTAAKAMVEQIGADYIVINGSMNGNIDTLRTEIMNFASSVSFAGGRKYVILDEADYLNPQSTQPALRNFMEEYSKNCGFILTCNFKNRIIEPLHSRCSSVEFKIEGKHRVKVAETFLNRVETILEAEGVGYDQKVVAQVITKYFPDFRRTINEIQRYSATGMVDVGILTDVSNEKFDELVQYLKDKNFTAMRKWVGSNIDSDPVSLLRKLYDNSSTLFKASTVPAIVLTIADYQYKSAFVADQEVNLVACLTQIMAEAEFI